MRAEIATYVRRFGDGPREVLAIHCTMGHSGAWSGLARALPADVTLTAFDLPHHGKSGDWDGLVDVHDVSTAMAMPFLARPVDLIGHSFGATVALRLAVENPGKVRSLTLIEPVFFAVARADDAKAFADHLERAAPYLLALEAGDKARAAQLFSRIWGDGRDWDTVSAHAQRYMIERMHLISAQNASLVEDSAQILAPGRLAKVDMPTLLVQGSQSPEIIEVINTALQKRLPQASRYTIEGAGHMAPITHPHDVAVVVKTILKMAQEQIDLVRGN